MGSFYLFYFNGLAFLCCSEAGCVPILCASLKEKEVDLYIAIVILITLS